MAVNLLIAEEEKACIDEIYQNAIDCLSDDDKQLPQVTSHLKDCGAHTPT